MGHRGSKIPLLLVVVVVGRCNSSGSNATCCSQLLTAVTVAIVAVEICACRKIAPSRLFLSSHNPTRAQRSVQSPL